MPNDGARGGGGAGRAVHRAGGSHRAVVDGRTRRAARAACLSALAERDRLVVLLTFYATVKRLESPRSRSLAGRGPRDPASGDGTPA